MPRFRDLLAALRDRGDVALVSSSPHHRLDIVTDRFDLALDAVVSAEDSEHGVEAGNRAGAATVGYRTNQNHDADLSHADTVVEGPDELRDLLLG